jgi:hypothetical protein
MDANIMDRQAVLEIVRGWIDDIFFTLVLFRCARLEGDEPLVRIQPFYLFKMIP